MYKKVTGDLTWVGSNDRRLAMFEGVYSVPYGVSYNSHLLKDEITVLFDTVDNAVQHMEPDHSAAFLEWAIRYPDMKIVCNT